MKGLASRAPALLLPALLLIAPSPCVASEPPAAAKALADCLRFGRLPETGPRLSRIPEGLIEKDEVEAVALPGSDGKAIAYVGKGEGAVTCGIAVYGRVATRLLRDLRKTIATNAPSMRPAPASLYKVDAPPATASYWGDPRATGWIGVLMLRRPPSRRAPTVEVQYHSFLMR